MLCNQILILRTENEMTTRDLHLSNLQARINLGFAENWLGLRNGRAGLAATSLDWFGDRFAPVVIRAIVGYPHICTEDIQLTLERMPDDWQERAWVIIKYYGPISTDHHPVDRKYHSLPF